MLNNSKDNKKWRKNNPEKLKAHILINYLVRQNKLIRQPCEICNNPKSHAHHQDYTKPLNIIWLCDFHHKYYHKKYKIYKKNKLWHKAKQLRKQGKYYQDIAKELNIGIGTAYKWLNKVNYD